MKGSSSGSGPRAGCTRERRDGEAVIFADSKVIRFYHATEALNEGLGIIPAIDRHCHQTLEGLILQLPTEHIAIHVMPPLSSTVITSCLLLLPVKVASTRSRFCYPM